MSGIQVNTVNVRGHGSVTNAIMQHTGIVPEVGMGATVLMYTDRSPVTIVAVRKNKAGKVVSVDTQGDKSTRVDKNGMSESQEYTYERNPNAGIQTYTLRKNGRWVLKGAGHTMWNGTSISIGEREKYHDYSF